VGQAGDTYLIFQNEDGVIMIDQHAADERINYEKIQRYLEIEHAPVQKLLAPIKMEVAQNEVDFVIAALSELIHYGFTIEHFGGTTFLIRAIPPFIKTQDHPTLIADMCLEIIHMGKSQSFAAIKRDIIQYLACHKSVKAGEAIWNRERVRNLIQELDRCQNPHHCAHGRPTYISITFDELEKLFHRKV
jgi:DNA mismatch repair protein MutL